jgi:transposase
MCTARSRRSPSSRAACAGDEGKIGVTPEALREWACTLRPDDEVALEATGNSDAIAMLLTPLVARVVVSNPRKTRAIAEAKVKTDNVDARILAQLLAADFLPPVWLPDDRTRMLRRQVARRTHLVRQRTRLKNQVHAILARNLAPTCPVICSARPAVGGWPTRPCRTTSDAASTRCCDSWTSTAKS